MFSQLEIPLYGITFWQLLRGDSLEAKNQVSLLLTSRYISKRVDMVFGTRQDHGSFVMKLSRLKVYGSEAHALMDYDSIPNVI